MYSLFPLHIAGKENIGKAVVIEITGSHAAAVVDILLHENIERVVFKKVVRKTDPAFIGRHEAKQCFRLIMACCEQQA